MNASTTEAGGLAGPKAVAVVVTHRVRPGMRDQVSEVWQAHMPAAVSGNPEHLAYFYTFDAADADVIRALQVYPSSDAAQAFLNTGEYRDYVSAVESLLAGPPEVAMSDVIWAKGHVDAG